MARKNKGKQKGVKSAGKLDTSTAEFGTVVPGWKRTIKYSKIGEKDKVADKDKKVTTIQFNIGLSDSEEVKKLKEEITKIELALMRHARDLSAGVEDQHDVLVARMLGCSACLADIVNDLTSAWERKWKVPGVEVARVKEKVKP
jgi:hypothetical protein